VCGCCMVEPGELSLSRAKLDSVWVGWIRGDALRGSQARKAVYFHRVAYG
jgi:hypothetical protein